MVLVMTPATLKSPAVRKEWAWAAGKLVVSSMLGDPLISVAVSSDSVI